MILDTLKQKLIEAQKAKDIARLSGLRYFLAQVKNREIELRPTGKEIDDEEVLKILNKQIKQREESILEFSKANRQDLVDKDTLELSYLKEYLGLFGQNA